MYLQKSRMKFKGEFLEKAIATFNKAAEGLHAIDSQLREVLDGKRVTKEGIDKRTREAMDAIIRKQFPRPSSIQTHLRIAGCRCYLTIRFSSPCNEEGHVHYMELNVHLGITDFSHRVWEANKELGDVPDKKNFEEIQKQIKALEEIEEEVSRGLNEIGRRAAPLREFLI